MALREITWGIMNGIFPGSSGEYVDCSVDLGKMVLQTHQPHSLQVRRGETLWVEMSSGECIGLSSQTSPQELVWRPHPLSPIDPISVSV